MFTAEEWQGEFYRNPEDPLKEVRRIQADALRFAAVHYVAAVSLNEAGMRLEALADAVERGDDLGSFMQVQQTLSGEESTGEKLRAYVQCDSKS